MCANFQPKIRICEFSPIDGVDHRRTYRDLAGTYLKMEELRSEIFFVASRGSVEVTL